MKIVKSLEGSGLLALSYPQNIRLDLKRFKKHFVTVMVVLKHFQKNLFHMLRRLARIWWGTGVRQGGKGCFFPFITNFLIEVANQGRH